MICSTPVSSPVSACEAVVILHPLTGLTRAGDSAGFSGVLELCADGQQPVRRHVLMSSRSTPLPSEDLTYLQAKGVFSIPKPITCNALLQAYIRHVHPIMPVIDGKVISSLYNAGQPTGRNLLLLWSVLFAAMSVGISSHVSA